MEGNLRRGRPTLCISEAFDFLNDPKYGDKSGKDADPLEHRLKKSVSDTGLLTSNRSGDFKHHTPLSEKNTYTILTFVQADQSNAKATVTESFEDKGTPSVESQSDNEESNKFTIVTSVGEYGDEHGEGKVIKAMPGSLADTIQCNRLGTGYLPSPDSTCTATQDESDLTVGDTGRHSGEIITKVREATHSQAGGTTNPQTGEIINFQERETISSNEGTQIPRHVNSDSGRNNSNCAESLQNIHGTNQNGDIVENVTQSINQSHSAPHAPQTHSFIQNGLSKSVININRSLTPKSEVNQNDLVTERDEDILTSSVGLSGVTSTASVTGGDSQSNTDPEPQSEIIDKTVSSPVCVNNRMQPDIDLRKPCEGSDPDHHDDDIVVLRPPSLTGPVTPSRRTQQIVSDVFDFLKDIDDEGEDDLKELGEEFELTSNESKTFSETKFSNEQVRRPPRTNSFGMMPPAPAPKPKRSSSSAHRESLSSNQSLQTEPVSPSRKAGPKSPPAVAPKPRRSTPSLVLNPPSSPTQERLVNDEDVQNCSPTIKESVIAQNPIPTINEGLVALDQVPCSNPDLPSPKLDSNVENVSSDPLTTNDNISLTSNPTFGNDSVNSDPTVDDGGWDFGPDNEAEPVNSDPTVDDGGWDFGPDNEAESVNSGPTQEEVPSSPVKMRPSLSRSEAIDDTQVTVETAGPVEEQEQNLTLRRKKSRIRSATNDEDSADSSDDDTGIYNESYRNSCWIQIAEEGTSLRSGSPAPPTSQSVDQANIEPQGETGPTPESETGPVQEGKSDPTPEGEAGPVTQSQSSPRPSHQDSKDDVFVESVSYKEGRHHKRSDSTTTTRSESEFKREYQFRRKCFVQRSDSQQEYHRLSAKFYDHERLLVLNRTETTSDLGLHILDSHPAVITSVDPGSPAEKAGVKKGQIILSVNQVNVLQASHAEIVSLVQEGSLQVSLEVASSDVSLVRDLQSPKVSGFMYKLSNSSFVRNWKKRYFVLRKDNCLYYYKNDEDCADPLGALPLLNYTVSKHTDTSKSHCFKAEKYGAKTYYFYVDTRDDMARWVCAMNEAAMVSKKRKDSWMDITSHNVGLPALEIRRAECTGYLRKSNKAMKNWNRRYCVLKDACLYYYKTMNSQNAQGMAHLHGYRVDVTGIPLKSFSFVLQPPESQMRTFYFVAENETDKLRWVEALRKSVERWIKVD